MTFLSNVIKTLSSLDSHAKKKDKFCPSATAQRMVLILCSVCVSIVLRPHSDRCYITERASKKPSILTLETFSKLIVEAGGYQQRAQISEPGPSREPLNQSQTEQESVIILSRGRMYQNVTVIFTAFQKHLNIGRDTNWSWKKYPPLMSSRGNRRRLTNL